MTSNGNLELDRLHTTIKIHESHDSNGSRIGGTGRKYSLSICTFHRPTISRIHSSEGKKSGSYQMDEKANMRRSKFVLQLPSFLMDMTLQNRISMPNPTICSSCQSPVFGLQKATPRGEPINCKIIALSSKCLKTILGRSSGWCCFGMVRRTKTRCMSWLVSQWSSKRPCICIAVLQQLVNYVGHPHSAKPPYAAAKSSSG